MAPAPAIRPPSAPDEVAWIEAFLRERWGAPTIVSRGRVHDVRDLPALIAFDDGDVAGVATYRIEERECELVTLDAIEPGHGIGGALLDAVRGEAAAAACRRLWLITSNDNIRAVGFYQHHGMRLVAVHLDAIEASRRLKPSIPLIAANGIPIRDELEFALELS